MNTNVTLTAEEFKVLHNSLCDLNRFSQFKEIEEIVERIRNVALKSAYEQDQAAFDRKFNHYHEIKEKEGFVTKWSLYEIADLNTEHGFPADSFVVYEDHWGEKTQHCAVYGSTWVDIYRAADNCIRNSGDQHHCFIEGFKLKNGNELHMYTGS